MPKECCELWIIVAFRSDSFGIILDVPHLIGWSAELYFDSACINSARAVNASLRVSKYMGRGQP